MNWQQEYKRKLISAEKAVALVQSGDRVNFHLPPHPKLLPQALANRRYELKEVTIMVGAPAFGQWFQTGWEESFPVTLETYSGLQTRALMDERRGDFFPHSFSLQMKARNERAFSGAKGKDIFMVLISPPDNHGFCSFGTGLWNKKSMAQKADVVIAEVDENQIRTYGDNYIHVSQIDYFVEHTPQLPSPEQIEAQLNKVDSLEWREKWRAILPRLDPERFLIFFSYVPTADPSRIERILGITEPEESIKQIAKNASTLIHDGDTIQIGVGGTTGQLVTAGIFEGKSDLGIHSELLSSGMVQLVKQGVITGKYKSVHPGKVVVTSLFPGVTWQDLEFVDGNPIFEQYQIDEVLSIAVIAAQRNLAAINNALFVDLTGQIGIETTLGFRLWNGPGGQLEFSIGAVLAKGGRSITVLPSTALGGATSRIVPLIEEGVMVNIPRAFADYVVTEYGIASLLGKTQRQRAEELIAIAHPDFRQELRQQARKLFYP